MTQDTEQAERALTLPLARLAWYNLWRHRRRTFLLLLVVAYATVAIIFFWSFFDGMVDAMLGGQARTLSAPVLVQTAAHYNDPDPENSLPTLDLSNQILNEAGVEGVAPRLEFPALLRSPYRTLGATVRGMNPRLEPQVSDLPREVGEGRMLGAPGELVLGQSLAADLDVRVGERLALDVQSLAGAQSAGLQVVGLLESGISAVDDTVVLMHIDDARRLTGVTTATGLALDVPQGQEPVIATALNENLLPQAVRAYSVSDLLGGVMAGIENKRGTMVPLVLLFAIFAAITVMSTVVVSVIERTREFGVMSALGLSPGQIARMVTLEAVYTTFIGFVVGAGLGYGLIWLLSTFNVMGPVIRNFYAQVMQGIAISDEFFFAAQLGYLAWAATTIVIAALLAIAVPGRRVRKLNPSEAMRAI